MPGYVAYVTRREKVWVVAQDRRGRAFKVSGSGLLGRALQHELDHLDGKLYIDYLDSLDDLIAVGQGDDDEDDGPDGDDGPTEQAIREAHARPRLTSGPGSSSWAAGRSPSQSWSACWPNPASMSWASSRPPIARPAVGEPSGRCPSPSWPEPGRSELLQPARLRSAEAIAEVGSLAARSGRPGRLRPARAGGAAGDPAPGHGQPAPVAAAPSSRGDADPGDDPGRGSADRRQPVPDGRRPRQRPAHRPGNGSPERLGDGSRARSRPRRGGRRPACPIDRSVAASGAAGRAAVGAWTPA